jgi:serine/threonine protein phosphatase PrpC
MDFFAMSERGLRAKNDDAYCAEQIESYFAFTIAGGLPGHAFDDIASKTNIETLKATVKDTAGSAINVLSNGYQECRC